MSIRKNPTREFTALEKDHLLRLPTIGYTDRPAAWMRSHGIGLDLDVAASALFEDMYSQRDMWINSLCNWLLMNEQAGCIKLMTDDESRTELTSFAEVMQAHGSKSDFNKAVVPLAKRLVSLTFDQRREQAGLVAVAHLAGLRLELDKPVIDKDYVLERLVDAVTVLAEMQDSVEQFQIAFGDAFEQCRYPQRVPYDPCDAAAARDLKATALTKLPM